MPTDLWFYAAAIPAVIIVGLSKGGFGGGVALIGVPLMSLAVPPIEAAAIMLPVLIVMDAVAVSSWWLIYDRSSLVLLLPATVLGIAIGWAVAAIVTDAEVRLIVGSVAVAFTVNYWFRGRLQLQAKSHNAPKAWFWGTVSGFTSFVSHAGGPPMQMYMLPLRLEPKLLAGTMVLLFAIVNLVKLVPYAALGQFSASNLAASAVLLPIAPVATWAGARLVRIISAETFYGVSYAALVLVGLKLIWDGVTGVF